MRNQELRTGGLWSLNEQGMHINCLELLAVSMAIQTFGKEKKNIWQGEEKHMVRTDNVATRAYINHLEGNSLITNEFISSADMELAHRMADIPNSRASSRSNEPGCRQGIEDSQGPV